MKQVGRDASASLRHDCRARAPMSMPCSLCFRSNSPWDSMWRVPSGSSGGRVRNRRSIALLRKTDRIRGSSTEKMSSNSRYE